MRKRWLLLILICLLNELPAEEKPINLSAKHLEAAREYDERNRASLVINANIQAHWMHEGQQFWYRRQSASSTEIAIVDSASGARVNTFVLDDLASALQTEIGSLALQLYDNPSKVWIEGENVWVQYMQSTMTVTCSFKPAICESVATELVSGHSSPVGEQSVYLQNCR